MDTVGIIASAANIGAGGGGGGYVAKAVQLDGGTWLNLDAFPGADSQHITTVAWFVMPTPGEGVSSMTLPFDWDAAHTEWLTIYFSADGSMEGQIENIVDGHSTGILLEKYAPAGSYVFDDAWHSLAMAIDVSQGPGADKIWQLYIDDLPFATTIQHVPDAYTFPFNGASVSITDDPADTSLLTGSVADMQIFVGQFIDLDNVTNRRNFVTADNKPVDPSVAAGAYGAPTLLFSGNAASWTSQAAAQGFAITGSLTNATTSPSD